ncbi:hypothetical protein DQM11_08190 [Leuconostoc pseudomesenteroides]|jgi:hypothetical protein|uniref:hypothetical protein n=1 Tax=Leuconostoc falkenbergense TaxID=2766470 RepID=UPI000E09960B|nr:hypothetical protein [Leuconostoc falkenbergense]MCT4410267.1 hypothetical protein [Leuconostoc falkenbergense]MDV3545895.1 hypothetical protein [Leuconostoc falkenbergense]RDG17934.1 hypothetical protein DQM11_08190 [Leuconostoc pseudomesenteroides]VTU62872.1 hypothetical protein AMBR_MGDJBKAP_02072 [Leuconostoc pseudomesenteroides]
MKIVSFDWLVDSNGRQAGILVKEYPDGYELKMISAMHAGQVAIFLKNCMKNIEVKELKFVLPEVKK